jgi:septum formation protein
VNVSESEAGKSCAVEAIVKIVLGSRSPQRHELLTGLIGEDRIEVLPPVCAQESGFGDTRTIDAIHDRLSQIAGGKADDVRLQLGAQRRATGIAAVICADTVIVVAEPDGRLCVLGQPCESNWQQEVGGWFERYYAERTHTAATAVCVVSGSGRVLERVVESRVTFGEVGSEWLEGYLASGESLGKAGGYAIQGLAGEVIERVEGSRSNVVGLPVEAVAEMFCELGVELKVGLERDVN